MVGPLLDKPVFPGEVPRLQDESKIVVHKVVSVM
jgi:hypothetical protein